MHDLVLFMSATIALNLTPGPDMLYVIARSISQGRKAGIVSAFGIAAGTLVHTTAVVLGLARLLETVPLAFTVVKLCGAVYLVYLGVRALLGASTASRPTVERTRLRSIFRQGLITNVLNPKVALFFVAFLPQFVDPARGSVTVQLITLAVLFNISGTIVNVLVALLASSAGRWTESRMRPSPVFQWLTGGLFIGLGIRLAFLPRR